MPVERFFDTNVLLYGYDLDTPAKRLVAKSLIETAWRNPGRAAISVQVLQEFQVNFVRRGHAPAEAAVVVEDFTSWPVIDKEVNGPS